MRRRVLSGLSLVAVFTLSLLASVAAAPFTPGNLVIYRVGSGTGALVATGNPVFLDEFTPAGSLVQSLPMPTALAGANRRLVAAGNATSEGQVNRSADGRYLALTGYDATLPGASALAGSASGSIYRTIGRVAHDGTVDTSTYLQDFADGGGPRSAVSADGTSFWVTGSTGGVRYAPYGATSSSAQLTTAASNIRQLGIFGGRLHAATGDGLSARIATIGSGLPTTPGQTVTGLPGYPTGGSPYGFYIADLSPAVAGNDTLYVADDSLGLRKFSLVGGIWTSKGIVGTSADDYRGLAATVSGSTVTLFATLKGGSTSVGGGELVAITDASGYNAAFTGTPALLATAVANTAFRGVAVAPYFLPDLTVEVSAPATSTVGVPFQYNITVRNIGNQTASGILVAFTPPNPLTSAQIGALTGSNGFVGGVGASVTFSGGTLAPGASAVLTVQVTPAAAGTLSTLSTSAQIDPANAIAESDETNNGLSQLASTVVTGSASPPAITTQPASQTIANGATATLTVAASGSPAPSFQWYQGASGDTANLIPGATSASFTTPALSTTISYWVQATNTSGPAANSDTATITVTPPPAPEIVVEEPAATELADGAAKDFGSGLVGATSEVKTFVVRNTGNATLQNLAVTTGGDHSGDFSADLSGFPASIAPGDSANIPVTFTPGAEGARSATLTIASNDADENPFVVNLSGSGLTPLSVAQQAYLKASNTGANDVFGRSVAISGDTVVVGADGEDSNTTGIDGDSGNNSSSASGAAYVFVRDATGSWSQQAYLKASNAGAGDQFGTSVAISGDTIIVGAFREDSNTTSIDGDGVNDNASNCGAAYVFVRDGSGNWTQQTYLKASNGETGDWFGWSVAISGDTAIVGATDEDSNAAGVNGDGGNNGAGSSGASYVFVRDGSGNWSQQAYLKPLNTGFVDHFGYSVAISGERAVVGAPDEDSNATGVNGDSGNNNANGAGAAYIFDRDGSGNWSQLAYLKASNTGGDDDFGNSVAISGNTAVVGAPKEDSNATGVNGDGANDSASNSGASYVFVRDNSGNWTQQAYLKTSNTEAGDEIGVSVAISGNAAVVGAYNEDSDATGVNGNDGNNSASSSGSAYVFVRDGSGSWSQQTYLKASNTETNDQFGGSVAIEGVTAVVGAGGEDSSATGVNGEETNNSASISGATYIYKLGTTASSPPLFTAQPASQIIANGATATLTVAASGSPSPTFQWYRGISGDTANLIPGATSSSFTTPALSTTTSYWVQATNTSGPAANSDTATITVTPPPAPEIVVEEPAATELADGAAKDFGSGLVGATSEVKTFVVRNTGNAALQNLAVTMGGDYPGDFTADLSGFPASIAPGDSANIPVTFTPGAEGARSATLTIASNDADENPIVVNLTGTGVSLPAITTQPLGRAIASGATATLAVSATGSPAPAFQWYRGTSGDTSNLVGGATAPSFITPALTASTSYWVRATNVMGSVDSQTAVVTVLPPLPVVATGAASGILPTSVLLEGTVTPNGSANATFQYGTSTSYGNSTSPQAVSGSTAQAVQVSVAGLAPGTLYHYRLGATRGLESVYGDDQTFTTAPGPPVVMTGRPFNVTTAEATLVGAVDARGLAAQIRFEYGLTTLYGLNATTPDLPAGGGVADVFKTIAGLIPNATYHCRIVAMTSSGTSYGQDVSFVATAGTGVGNGIPTAEPEVFTGVAANVETQSAELLGTVDSNGGTTIVNFEYGTTTAYGQSLQTTFDVGNVDTAAAVSLTITGLSPGTRYHYRLVASNSRGTSYGADAEFTTDFLPPFVSTGGATALSTTSARVAGSVNPHGASSGVIIEYGTNPSLLNLTLATTPATVGGSTTTSVQADLANLAQGTTYYYRVKATNSFGDSGEGITRSFDVGILSGLDRRFPDEIAAADHAGSLQMNLTPAGIGGWRFAGEPGWRAPGSTAGGLASGDRRVEFRPVPGYLQPPVETIGILGGAGPLMVGRAYTPSGATGSGAVEITLKPASIGLPEVPVESRAQWRLAGESDTMWRDSGATAGGLVPGTHVIECKPVAGRSTPPPASVRVEDGEGEPALATITYYIAPDPVGTPPGPLGFTAVSSDEDRPYAFVGQILGDAGAGTGFIVKPRVVATAGHVVFDDGTLAPATGLGWLFQRDAGVHEPAPVAPRGFYLMTGYAARRGLDNSPGVSSPQSQNLDAAALYFTANVSRSGFSGFLASDAPVNEFVVSSLQKTLVGYPVDGIPAADIGKMHATPASPVSFASAFGQTYTSTAIRSGGGNSGGPLCVRDAGGTWYPAAIFLGGTAQTVVRAIDSDVSDLFGFAEASASAGVGETGGTAVVGTPESLGTPGLGGIRVFIEPASARAAGARWRINSGDPYQPSGNQIPGLSPNSYTVLLSTVPGFLPPAPQPFAVTAGQLGTLTFTYEEIISPPVISSPSGAPVVRGQPLSYLIQATNSPQSFNLFGNLPAGVSFNALTGMISGIPQEAGLFPVTVSATNPGGSGTKLVTIAALPVLGPQSLTAPWEQAMSYQIVGSESGAGVSWTAGGLPQGLSINASTGLVSGTPLVAGVFPAAISLSKNGATSAATLTLTITGTAPVFTLQPPAARQIEFGTGTTFTVTATGVPAPSYQWFLGESGDTTVPVGGSPTFGTPALTATTRYWARATSISGSADSTSVVITLTPSTNPDFTAIEPSAGQLSPPFAPGNPAFGLTVPNSVPAISFVPRVRISQTTVTVNGQAVTPGTPSQIIPLDVGANTVTFESTAGDGVTKKSHAVTVFRSDPPVAVTGIATAIGHAAATLNGTVDPNGSVTAYFQYRAGTGAWLDTPGQTVNGADPLPVQFGIGNLEGSTAYGFRIVAVTPSDTFVGGEAFFTTAPEPPLVATGNPAAVQTDRAIFTGAVNPNGLPLTALRFHYGSSEELLGTIVNVALPDPNGGNSVSDVTSLVTGLVAQADYYYRLEAVSAGGTAFGKVVTFKATTGIGGGDGLADSPPSPMTTLEATDQTTASAVLRGSTFPNDGATLAWFEYGLAGETETRNTVAQDIGNGSGEANVTQFLGGLLPATGYRFRLVAQNAMGINYGEYRSFTTVFNPPVASTVEATRLTLTSALVRGSVRARGAEATVHVEFGTDGIVFPGSALITGPNVTGDVETPVSAVVAGLNPATRYYARVRADSSGGIGRGETISFVPGALMGLEQALPPVTPPSEHSGQLEVDVVPDGIGAWRFEGETRWRAAGSPATGLTTGDRIVEFQPVPGFIAPLPESVGIVSGAAATVITGEYYRSGAPGDASLTVHLLPASLADAGLPVASRAQWRLAGMAGDPWKDSGATLSSLEPGTYLIECKSVSGQQAPTPRGVIVAGGESRAISRTYFPSSAPNLNPPSVVPFTTVSSEEQLPYRFVGQVLSDTGSFSGFAVKRRVVATAAQAVFDESTLSVTNGIQWLLQRDNGTHEPDAQVPRGLYIFDGYAARRETEGTPGTLSAESRNLNVAALYFAEDAGRGGFSGFLSSDAPSNPYLVSSSLKSLAGYPVAGISLANQGRMHATAPSTSSYAALTSFTFDSSAIRGSGGMEGGPLSVRTASGTYFPAGIYVGGTTRGAVRAIDATVVDLFSRAEISANGGGNSTSGGISHIGYSSFGYTAAVGSIKVILHRGGSDPKWTLDPPVINYSSGGTASSRAPGTYIVRLPVVPGFLTPPVLNVTVTAGQTTVVNFTYLTALDSWRQDAFGTIENTGDAADSADPDGDGQLNSDEYTSGTHPKNGSDRFKVASMARNGGGLQITVHGKAGRRYHLQRNPSLSSGAWSPVNSSAALAADGDVQLLDDSPTPGAGFYRVVVELASP